MNFGITPAQIASIAGTWSKEGDAVAALDFPAHAHTDFATLTALAQCARAGKKSTSFLGHELARLGDALALFNAQTAESDAAAAGEIASGTAP